ncbi:hypothetical protein Bbelb_216910 [Branchiostoma belcheri]|nr:hypothetical protein Bbelb_216910 [Branchiostoma belcheri]
MESKTPGTVLDTVRLGPVLCRLRHKMGWVRFGTQQCPNIRVADVSFTAFTGKAEDNILHRTSLARDCMIQSNLHPRAYKALNPQFLNPMYGPSFSSAADPQADSCDGVLRSQGDGGSNNNARFAAAESGQTVEVTVGDDNIEPDSPDEIQAKNCDGIHGEGYSNNNAGAAATESGQTVEVTVGDDNIEPDSPDELQSDNCDDFLPYAVFYEETDCSNNGTSATAAESGKTVNKDVDVDDIEPCQDDTPSTKNTQRNAPTSHENGNNVGQQKTTYGCKCQRMWIKHAAVTAANLVLSTIIFLVIFYTSCQGSTCPQANSPGVAYPTPKSPSSGWKSAAPHENFTSNAYERATYGLRESNFTILTCNCCTDSARSTCVPRTVLASSVLTPHFPVDLLNDHAEHTCTIPELLSREPEKPDNVDGQPSHTDPTPPALSTRPENYFSDCSEIHTAKTGYDVVSNGVYKILPADLSSPISVYCDQTTDGGGWTVIQRRFDGSVDFNRPYDALRYGFGSPNGEQWLGLENIYRLTDQHTYTLYVQLEDWNNVVKYAKYSSFSVGSSPNYRLSVSGYSGTAGDGFGSSSSISDYDHLSGQPFSARDVDCDTNPESCAVSNAYTGGWWYKFCGWSALNGPYLRPSDYTDHSGWGIYWATFGGSYRNYLKKSKMMVRPANFKT